MGYECEDLGDQTLLDGCFLLLLDGIFCRGSGIYELSVELRQARLSGIIEDQHGVYHVCRRDCTRYAELRR